MLKLLIIAQDLRISGTSEGLVSRSFIAKLRRIYPNALIDLLYLKFHESEDELDLLPIDSIEEEVIDFKIPTLIRWFNKVYWRIFNESLNELYIQKKFEKRIKLVNHTSYDFVFIRSAGLDYEAILGAKNLSILKKSIINFHDPYPVYWCSGSNKKLDNLELYRMRRMSKVVSNAKFCITPAQTLTNDMAMLYNAFEKFRTLPHQFDSKAFNLNNNKGGFEKLKKITICYQGAIQFNRNIKVVIDAYLELLEKNSIFKEKTEFVVRVKNTVDIIELSKIYANIENVRIFGPAYFSNSSYEQLNLATINVVLDNGISYSNILVGKAPFLDYSQKPILCLTPQRSELRRIIKDERFLAGINNKEEIKRKLKVLIEMVLQSENKIQPFGDYFSDANFKLHMDKIINDIQKNINY